jgi:hypothetical protein
VRFFIPLYYTPIRTKSQDGKCEYSASFVAVETARHIVRYTDTDAILCFLVGAIPPTLGRVSPAETMRQFVRVMGIIPPQR